MEDEEGERKSPLSLVNREWHGRGGRVETNIVKLQENTHRDFVPTLSEL